MPSSPNNQAPGRPGYRHTVVLLCIGTLLAASAVGAPLAVGALLQVIAATAAGRPSESTRLAGLGDTYRRGFLAIAGAAAWLLPGPVMFGLAGLAFSVAVPTADPQRSPVWMAALAASLAYVLFASVFAEAAVVEFAVRRRLAPVFDVGALWTRVVVIRGFGQAWLRATASIAVAVALSAAVASAAGWPPVTAVALALAVAFLSGVPAAFTLGAFARHAYGLLACVAATDPDLPSAAGVRS